MCVARVIALSFMLIASAQTSAAVLVEVRAGDATIADAEVTVAGVAVKTDAKGIVRIPVKAGSIDILVTKEGFAPRSTTVNVAEGQEQKVLIELSPAEIEESVTVSATRTNKRLEDQPMRVEVLVREEIEEKMLMTPGDIVMMLNEMGGMRVQATSPSLGAASVRVQGMKGRYTRFLSDGLPLFGEVGGLGLLQIPPMDLAQVEVIKGTASSLYGAGAMAGVVNLVSRRPGTEPERELMLNRSSRGATDAILWYSTPLSNGWALSLLGGGHFQEQADVDDDGWSNLPGYSRGVIRPRLFWNNGSGSSLFVTAGATLEDRKGGTHDDAMLPATGTAYRESLTTRRSDGGALWQTLWDERYVVTARAAVSRAGHDHVFGEIEEDDSHTTGFGEIAVRGTVGAHTWVAGAAVERDQYRSPTLSRFNHTFTIPGIFVQDDVVVAEWISLSASARFDHHSEYGSFVSPRLAAFFRSGHWTSRISAGAGFFGPSALTEETEAAGLTRLTIPVTLKAERGSSASFDIGRADGPLSYTATLFASRVADPIHVDRSAGLVLTNSDEATTNVGVELLATARHAPFALTANYTFVQSRESDDAGRVESPLTPRHSAGVVGMWEREDVGRVGLEIYYTGRQRLEENPYATASQPYVIAGLLAERQFGPLRLFVNGENLTGVRQSTWDPLLRPDRGPDGRWTVDAWAPLDGRTINGGIRLRF